MFKKIISSILLFLFINLNFPDIVFAKSYQIYDKQHCYDKNSEMIYLYKVIKNKKYGAVSLDGDLILPVKYSRLFVNPACYIETKKQENSKNELYSLTGELIIPAVYDYLIPNFGKYIIVKDNEKFGLIDYQNNIILPIEFNIYKHTSLSGLDSEYILENNQKVMLITDEKITQLPYEDAYFDSRGTLFVFLNKKKGVYGIEKGKCIIPAKYDDVSYWNENLFIAKLNNKYSVYDKDGNVIFNNNISEYKKKSDLVVIKKDNNKYDLYYIKDKIRNKSAKNEKPEIKSGKELLKPLLTDKEFIDFEYYYFDNNYSIKAKDNGKFGVVRFNSETELFTTFIPFIYDSISIPNRVFNNYITKKGNEYYILNPKTGQLESKFTDSAEHKVNNDLSLLSHDNNLMKVELFSENEEGYDKETSELFKEFEKTEKEYLKVKKENEAIKRRSRKNKMPIHQYILGSIALGVIFSMLKISDLMYKPSPNHPKRIKIKKEENNK